MIFQKLKGKNLFFATKESPFDHSSSKLSTKSTEIGITKNMNTSKSTNNVFRDINTSTSATEKS